MLDIIDVPNLVSLEYIGDQIPETFVDANLLWSCHPRKVILVSTMRAIITAAVFTKSVPDGESEAEMKYGSGCRSSCCCMN
ncbi:hypothetical protein HAX54_013138 [Datura stramonium]|uniref:Uncharacterized protein n=1 Tax=Datura stramonium TaxID=4076 RepID=A0ABS8TNI2_DATST|nr:hypothetical protein [Datura stramonium]